MHKESEPKADRLGFGFLLYVVIVQKCNFLFSEIFGDAECEIIHFVNCEILLRCRNVKLNKSPHARSRISHGEAIFHARMAFHKSRKDFFSEE